VVRARSASLVVATCITLDAQFSVISEGR
jgi:hypothetical protein